jgi:hypothetical protein
LEDDDQALRILEEKSRCQQPKSSEMLLALLIHWDDVDLEIGGTTNVEGTT